MNTPKKERSYLRIATEEAFAPASMLAQYRKLLDGGYDDPGFNSLWGFYIRSNSERARNIIERLEDLGERRIRDMDATGIDRQIIALTAPGVQVFDPATASSVAIDANDLLAAAVRQHPDRLTGMVAVAPHDAANAVKEMERGVRKLGFRAVIINSHTQGEYLDQSKFWPLFEAAEALGVPIYIHPSAPPKQMIQPFLEAGLDGAIFGFAVETGLHLLRIICAGVFDRFPKLQIIVGHTGEALPFWLYRIDYMHRAGIVAKRYPFMPELKRKPSDYLRENVYVTNSGVAWEPAIVFCQQVLGVDRVMYAMDYPYQYQKDEVDICDNLRISDADKKKFFQTNAEYCFGLPT